MKIYKTFKKTIVYMGMCLLAVMQANAQSTLNNLVNTISISTLNNNLYESWPSPAVVVIRRTGDLRAVTIPITITGTATSGSDYISSVGASVTIPMGKKEVWVLFAPKADQLIEGNETIRVELQVSPAYNLATQNFVTINILDAGLPADDEINRFLIQAGFGADPDEAARVKTLGFSAWINEQINRPKGYARTRIIERKSEGGSIYHHDAQPAVWKNIMRRTPVGQTDTTDILRQRIAYSLMQIFVISQNQDAIMLSPEGVTIYYDYLVDGALGNFRTMLGQITLNPLMGVYLSHLGNKKPDLANNSFPDQNFARELMQLFTIGLWELNLDGTKKLLNGQPIPTYVNADIAEFARVFTGLKYGGPSNTNQYFENAYEEYNYPMKAYAEFHDTDSKKLLNGLILPSGQTTMQDINATLDHLFNHPNVGPFISNLLIQRLITSNPSPEYIARVASKFNNDGNGVRGNMAEVVKAILLYKEARDFSKTQEPTFGKMREPYMTIINMAKTFNAQSASGQYNNTAYMYDYYLQEIFRSPSVFNFYLPTYRAPGLITASGKFSPEFQILTAVTAIETQNNLIHSVENEISRYGSSPEDKMVLNYEYELPLVNDPDALIRELSSKLTGGTLSPKSFEIIRDAVLKIPTTQNNWEIERVKLATYLTSSSAEFNIQK